MSGLLFAPNPEPTKMRMMTFFRNFGDFLEDVELGTFVRSEESRNVFNEHVDFKRIKGKRLALCMNGLSLTKITKRNRKKLRFIMNGSQSVLERESFTKCKTLEEFFESLKKRLT